MSKKPIRLDSDPKDCDVVFDKDGMEDCTYCCLSGSPDCGNQKCGRSSRPEGVSVYYVKKTAKRRQKKGLKIIEPGVFDITTVVGSTLVIEAERNNGTLGTGGNEIFGAFANEAEALKRIAENAKDTFADDSGSTLYDLENWGSDYLIVEVKRVVRPVPRVNVECDIKIIAGGEK
ncbi:MAG: hypothetical protein WCS18_11450 [Sphaerochaetaceae bacterium]